LKSGKWKVKSAGRVAQLAEVASRPQIRFPLSTFHFPLSTFHFPLSTFHFPLSTPQKYVELRSPKSVELVIQFPPRQPHILTTGQHLEKINQAGVAKPSGQWNRPLA
jgi:hypothetical protein